MTSENLLFFLIVVAPPIALMVFFVWAFWRAERDIKNEDWWI